MDKKIIISISAIIIITIIGISITQIDINDNESTKHLEQSDDINSMLEKIKHDKINNDSSENPYVPKEREWISSGPFSIDRSEYVLGEKVFFNIDYIPENVKGEIRFIKILNSTHHQPYKSIIFDGSKKQNNFYLSIYPSIPKGFCTSDSLVGEWEVIFDGTPYEKLKFKFLDKMIPGMENQFESVC